jgi:hypothetical protein
LERSAIPDFEGGKTRYISLGPIGRPEAAELNATLASYIPTLVALFENGKLVPGPYELIGKGGFEDGLKALEHQQTGAGGSKKVVVKVQGL